MSKRKMFLNINAFCSKLISDSPSPTRVESKLFACHRRSYLVWFLPTSLSPMFTNNTIPKDLVSFTCAFCSFLKLLFFPYTQQAAWGPLPLRSLLQPLPLLFVSPLNPVRAFICLLSFHLIIIITTSISSKNCTRAGIVFASFYISVVACNVV